MVDWATELDGVPHHKMGCLTNMRVYSCVSALEVCCAAKSTFGSGCHLALFSSLRVSSTDIAAKSVWVVECQFLCLFGAEYQIDGG